MSKSKIALIAVGAVAAIGLAVFLGGRAYFHSLSAEQKAEKIAGRIAWHLNMTDDQKVKLNVIVKSAIEKIKPYHDEHFGMKNDVLSLIRNDTFDRKKAESLADKRMKDMEELRPFMIDKLAEIHALLTPEQREKAAKFIEKHHGRYAANCRK